MYSTGISGESVRIHTVTAWCNKVQIYNTCILLFILTMPVADPGFPVGGGADPLGGANLRRIHFSAKTYAKTKEIDPVGGGGGGPVAPPDPPMHA